MALTLQDVMPEQAPMFIVDAADPLAPVLVMLYTLAMTDATPDTMQRAFAVLEKARARTTGLSDEELQRLCSLAAKMIAWEKEATIRLETAAQM